MMSNKLLALAIAGLFVLPAVAADKAPDAITEKGLLDTIKVLASDEFEARAPGSKGLGKPASYAREVVDEYTAHDYHQPTDTVRDNWDFSGGVQDIQLLFQVGLEIANGEQAPQWHKTSEFAGLRK
jgi:hypothetical protein